MAASKGTIVLATDNSEVEALNIASFLALHASLNIALVLTSVQPAARPVGGGFCFETLFRRYVRSAELSKPLQRDVPLTVGSVVAS